METGRNGERKEDREKRGMGEREMSQGFRTCSVNCYLLTVRQRKQGEAERMSSLSITLLQRGVDGTASR